MTVCMCMEFLVPQSHVRGGARGALQCLKCEPPARGSKGRASLCARQGAAVFLPTGLAVGVYGPPSAAKGLHVPRLLTDILHTQCLETYKNVANYLEKK